MATRKRTQRQHAQRLPKGGAAASEVLLLILGSGPAIAAFDSLLQAHAADGLMYQNAVADQQKTNVLGMAMTAMMVSYALDPDYVGQFRGEAAEMTKKKPQRKKRWGKATSYQNPERRRLR